MSLAYLFDQAIAPPPTYTSPASFSSSAFGSVAESANDDSQKHMKNFMRDIHNKIDKLQTQVESSNEKSKFWDGIFKIVRKDDTYTLKLNFWKLLLFLFLFTIMFSFLVSFFVTLLFKFSQLSKKK